ncbi:MAG: hypothetical protein IK012_02470 [Fibrobacter sp.]|uniref:FISUMP domain-containing protein n=1 Tax=Fibrobacter sp. TaxID=35828 RepID=UPI0025C4CABE|nr:FISUMP domain-containing protein [Fibrobacter sp.]MBR4784101.1 hypothetical protein [Fibrobacter sp.]
MYKNALSIAPFVFSAIAFTACGDDDSFAPISKDRGYDYSIKSKSDFADIPCNEKREGREAVVGRDKDSYICKFDYSDSAYIWIGDTDTLTAEGREFKRAESSSSSDDEDESSSSRNSSSSQSSSSRSSSSYSSSSSSSSSSSYSSSSYSSSSYSSSSNSSSSSLTPYTKESHFNPDIDYGTMKDPRDGKTYRTVVVDGVTWMAENLNYAGHEIGESSCYAKDDEYCELYGRLYSRDAVMNSTSCVYGVSCNLGSDPIQGICPDGWHIPTKPEVQSLLDYISPESALKSAGSNWNYPGTDAYGLSFVGAGNWDNGTFEDIHKYEVMWMYAPGIAQYFLLISGSSGDAEIWDYSSSKYYSTVRCIKGDGVVPASSSSLSSSSYSSSSLHQEITEPLLEAGDQFNPTIDYGTLTDTRDGKTYKTVVVDGVTWMAENLNYADNEIGVSTCFNNEDRFCEIYGRLYSRDAALNSSKCAFGETCNLGYAPIQGICPDGWHIPSESEANSITELTGGVLSPLISAEGWRSDITPGTDRYGLSFVAAGCYASRGNSFSSLGDYSYFWYYTNTKQSYLLLRGHENNAITFNYSDSELYTSVRCIKD